MLLIGVALQIKYSVVFEGLFLGLWMLWRERLLGATPGQILRRATLYAGVAMVPTLIAWAVYGWMGNGDAWLYANFGSIFLRRSDPPLVLLVAFLKIMLMLGPLLTVSVLSARMPADEDHRVVRNLFFGWLAASMVGLVVFGSWFNHYALPVMLPACLCCAGYLGNSRIGRRIVAPLLLLVALVGGVYTTWSARWYRGNAEQLHVLAEAVGHGPGCLYVYSGNTSLYSHSGRCMVTPWIFPSHLSRERENGAIGTDQLAEIRRIFARRPGIIVMRPAYAGERAASRQLVLRELAQGRYGLRGRYPLGNLMLDVYAAPGAPARAANSPS
jgi:hypothetical protein